MLLRFALPFFLIGACINVSTANAAIIINETFESYADDAAFKAVWGSAGLGTLSTAVGNPGQSASHPGGTDNLRSFTTFNPTLAEKLRLTGQIFDDGTSANKRMSIGLRDAASANIIEMGFYNGGSHYASRVVLFSPAGANPSWVGFPGLGAPVRGWHTFTVDISADSVDFALDLGSDGTIDSAHSVAAVAGPSGFNQLRIGGPSNLSSAGGGANFDNIRLETIQAVPEPSALGLCALLGGLGFVRRRRA